jgi:poly(3-hydroxybutyrate) depolymerase
MLPRCIALVLLMVSSLTLAQPPVPGLPTLPEKEFSSESPPAAGAVNCWRSTPVEARGEKIREGIRYAWRLPIDYKTDKSYDLVVVCHGTGTDHRWGLSALDARTFMPGTIVVCPDGMSSLAQGIRTFRADDGDVLAFRDFILEMTRTFPADRIFLYGFGQGGAFALNFAGQFPSLAEGIVAHACSGWEETVR